MDTEHTFFDGALPPGEILRKMLESREWTQDTLAAITKMSRTTINNIVAGRSGVTPDTAAVLGAAFGNDATDWLKADAAYRLSQVTPDDEISQRAHFFKIAPIHDMRRRGWIKTGDSTEEIEAELRKFFEQDVSGEVVEFPVSPRHVEALPYLNSAERAWCFRARQLAIALLVSKFASRKLEECERKLRQLAAYPKEARHLPKVLSEYGIRLVIVEPIPGAKIDGAAFWIKEEPVIALSIRYDRIDGFWFTLMHEFAHILYGDGISVDTDLIDNTKGIVGRLAENVAERRADARAANSLIPNDEMESFIRRVGPLYSRERVIQFAHRVKIHPGIIVGQLQHKGEVGYSALRDLLVKVRTTVTTSALTDGWDQTTSKMA
jgi:HTH-type transcriptional regulator/antitoxin HigA